MKMDTVSIILVLFLNTVQVVFGGIHEPEKRSLLNLYTSTNGPDWSIPRDLISPVSTWYGVRVENNTLMTTTLFRTNLSRKLPNSIVELSNLRVQNLALNSIQGDISPRISKLRKLIVITLGKNQLSGSIPKNLGGIGRLVIMDLLYNKLSVMFPRGMRKLSHLKLLQFSYNELYDHLTVELGDVKSLEQIDLAHNRFNGPVAENIGSPSNLKSITLDDNNVSGDFPERVIFLPKLEISQLKNNDFVIPHLHEITTRKPKLLKIDFTNQEPSYGGQDYKNSHGP